MSSTIWKEKKLRLAAVVNFNNLSPKTQLFLAEEAYIMGYKCPLTHSTCRRHESSELVMFTLKFAQDTFTVLYHREKCTLRALHLSQCYRVHSRNVGVTVCRSTAATISVTNLYSTLLCKTVSSDICAVVQWCLCIWTYLKIEMIPFGFTFFLSTVLTSLDSQHQELWIHFHTTGTSAGLSMWTSAPSQSNMQWMCCASC